MKTSCCLKCHFDFEEQWCIPYLPPELARWLRTEHRRLREAGYPREQVEAHAAEEMGVFRRYVPPDILATVEADHALFDAGKLG